LGYLSANVGIIICPNVVHTLDELLKHADSAMYLGSAEGQPNVDLVTVGSVTMAITKGSRSSKSQDKQ